ncbi:hypothetical protein CAPTEDRAFT_19313 [Capitella teleta]|uniref:Clathrin light chain n=1 Tax=Capitella teleta TaxID=283909 RepID=R7UY20_CAPTE|nr:hypothetical protein CAPTEDRAFT_19313 [Capitella teleta]|eukprot:ELU11179.1 hypothetical protein CAPTEDRAFT_19313 [Capitella teleta]
MDDFDTFASSEPTTGQEEDPAAAFLAREQTQMAELEGDNLESQGEPSAEDAFAAQPSSDDMFGSGGAAEEGASGAGDFDPMTSGVEGDEEALPSLPRESVPLQTLADYPIDGAPPAVDPYASVRSVDTMRAEPEKLKIWREEQKKMLEKKDQDSELKKIEWREIASKEIEDWYKHRDEQLTKTKSSNREAEAAFVHDRDEKIPGNEWECITRLCDFNPKSSRSTKDVARMRSILLQLKQTPLQR